MRRSKTQITRDVLSSTLLQLSFAFFIFFLSILLGASPWKWVSQTALASLYFSSNALAFIEPNCSEVNSDSFSFITLLLDPVVRIVVGPDFDLTTEGDTKKRSWTLSDEINRFILYSTLLVTIPFMILNVLDNGNQIQRWPVPVLLGSTVGLIVGVGLWIFSICGSIFIRMLRRDTREKLRMA